MGNRSRERCPMSHRRQRRLCRGERRPCSPRYTASEPACRRRRPWRSRPSSGRRSRIGGRLYQGVRSGLDAELSRRWRGQSGRQGRKRTQWGEGLRRRRRMAQGPCEGSRLVRWFHYVLRRRVMQRGGMVVGNHSPVVRLLHLPPVVLLLVAVPAGRRRTSRR